MIWNFFHLEFTIKELTWSQCNLWCWRRLLRVPWTARRSSQSILKEISPEYSLEALMLKLKLQYFGHLMQTADSLKKTLILGKTEGKRRSRWQGMRWLDSVIDSMGMNLRKFKESGDSERQKNRVCSSPWGYKEHDLLTERQCNLIECLKKEMLRLWRNKNKNHFLVKLRK